MYMQSIKSMAYNPILPSFSHKLLIRFKTHFLLFNVCVRVYVLKSQRNWYRHENAKTEICNHSEYGTVVAMTIYDHRCLVQSVD